MAGTLTISTLSDGTNSTSSTNCIQGSAKAWVNFAAGNGSTAGTINGSYNVSSITVNGTGNYTVTFTNAMTNANYVACCTATIDSTDSRLACYQSLTTTNYKVLLVYPTNNASTNAFGVSTAVFR